MNEAGKIIIAGLAGAIVSLLISNGMYAAMEKKIHYVAYEQGPAPPDPTPEERAASKARHAQEMAERKAKRIAYASECTKLGGAVMQSFPQGLIGCSFPAGAMPPDSGPLSPFHGWKQEIVFDP